MTEPVCVECARAEVKSRRNTTCNTCGATVCVRCQGIHFTDKHEEDDYANWWKRAENSDIVMFPADLPS